MFLPCLILIDDKLPVELGMTCHLWTCGSFMDLQQIKSVFKCHRIEIVFLKH